MWSLPMDFSFLPGIESNSRDYTELHVKECSVVESWSPLINATGTPGPYSCGLSNWPPLKCCIPHPVYLVLDCRACTITGGYTPLWCLCPQKYVSLCGSWRFSCSRTPCVLEPLGPSSPTFLSWEAWECLLWCLLLPAIHMKSLSLIGWCCRKTNKIHSVLRENPLQYQGTFHDSYPLHEKFAFN